MLTLKAVSLADLWSEARGNMGDKFMEKAYIAEIYMAQLRESLLTHHYVEPSIWHWFWCAIQAKLKWWVSLRY